MKFQQTITTAREDLIVSSVVINFTASSWEAAGRWGDMYQRKLGMEGPSYSSLIVYAPRPAPAPLCELLAEDAERAAFDLAHPHPHTPGQRYLSSTGGHQ